MTAQGADAQRPVRVLAVVVQAGDAVDVHEQFWRGEPQLHQRDEALPPGQHLWLTAAAGQQADRLGEGARCLVTEPRRVHTILQCPAWALSRNCGQARIRLRTGPRGPFRRLTGFRAAARRLAGSGRLAGSRRLAGFWGATRRLAGFPRLTRGRARRPEATRNPDRAAAPGAAAMVPPPAGRRS